MNKGIIIGIIVVIVIGIGVAIAGYNEPNESSGEISPEGSPEPQEFSVTLEEQVGIKEKP